MLVISKEVKHALSRDQAVVALESTIIAHGLPFPDNLAIARELEAKVRARGAVPATIAIFNGHPKIGLNDSELEQLANPTGNFTKAGMTDIAPAMALKQNAATTVSGTNFLAAKAGIQVFATGGIGGVHLGDSDDVSSDLLSLSQTQIAVVSAGPKAILDLPRTLERLETLGVLVMGYHTQELPSFYSRLSGLSLEYKMDDDDRIADVLNTRWALGQGGVLIANPPPVKDAMAVEDVQAWIKMALAEAHNQKISGKALTPFLLSYLNQHSKGQTLKVNRSLALHNADVAARLAIALAQSRSNNN